ncbi:MAG TPA: NAD+ synthase, partial [Gemmatimonadaceae bacterium]|nr:NAD+ synthase [Gemmatimonadaceae bacterium]
TALTGYFLEGGVREHARTAGTLARDLDRVFREHVSTPHTLDVVVGFYEIWQNTLYNSGLYVTLGAGDAQVRHVHRKVFLPTYGLFDEERFVERGRDVRAFETPWGRAAILICEDAWHSLTGTIAALDGAQIVFVCSAAPARGIWPRADDIPGPASVGRWDRLIRDIAEEHGVATVLANLTGSEGGKVFPGASMIFGPKGDIRARGPVWEEAIVTATIDLADATRARADAPMIADLAVMLPHLRASLTRVLNRTPVQVAFDAPGTGEPERADSARAASTRAVPTRAPSTHAGRIPDPPASRSSPVPVVRHDTDRARSPTPLEIDGAMTEQWLVHFIREEMDRRALNFAVVGVSGGVDSAVTAYLATRALGADRVLGVRLPYRTSSRDSLDHASLVIDALGIASRTLDISAAVNGYLEHEPDAGPTRRGNVMARVRMTALFDLAAKHNGIPLGTGNKTERLLGYFTWHADDAPPVNPLGDLFKTQVWALARHLGVPAAIVDKAPTADLVAGQTDEGDLGIDYATADDILNWTLNGYSAAELAALGFDAQAVALVRRRLEGTHWKRRLPTVAMLSSTAIGESYLRPVDY